MDAFEGDRAGFEALLDEIDDLKDEREDANAMAADSDLQAALRRARRSAELLNEQRRALTRFTAQVGDLEIALLASVNERMRELEASLAALDVDQRRSAVVELNRMTEIRNAYQHPLPAVPEVRLDEILAGLEEDVTPEDLLATADELDDNARRLERHLEELDARIEELTRQGVLQERARSAYSEASLFEEGVNTGARPERPADSRSDGGDDGDATSAGVETGSTADRTHGDAAVPAEPPADAQSGVSGSGTGRDDDGMGAAAPDSDYDSASEGYEDEAPGGENTGGGGALADPSFDDGDHSRGTDDPDGFTGTPDLETPISSSPALDVSVVPSVDPRILDAEVDELSGRSGRSNSSGLVGLERERDELRRQLQEIRRQRELLLRRAEALESIEF